MIGSENKPKTSQMVENQLPLKGFSTAFTDVRTGRVYRIEALGDGRYRIHTGKRQPSKK